jgi:hypothetical protein
MSLLCLEYVYYSNYLGDCPYFSSFAKLLSGYYYQLLVVNSSLLNDSSKLDHTIDSSKHLSTIVEESDMFV